MSRVKKRWCMVCTFILIVVAGVCAARFSMPASYGREIIAILGQASSVLFGVFGVWLGICYHDDVDACLQGLHGEELRRKARDVKMVSERCRVLFTGLAIAAFIFVFALTFAALDVPLTRLTAVCNSLRMVLKAVFFTLVLGCVVAQVYSVLAPLAIMAEAMLKIKAAKHQAEDMLHRLPPEGSSS